ncbi:cytochrome b [Sphingomonas koreensis]|uniref:Cytochrome b n=1 Tax=Sphingomonas koreensis TaxID=93064 RepID=A0A430G504_9SPHN|nr:cytochrome b [Sphingomonas koreensis]RSY86962.1 cytochrome b [Sphingomonas koreensis]
MTDSALVRYSRGAILLHWLIAALLIFNLAYGFLHDSLPRDWRIMPIHKAIGITVLVLTLARIGWRLTHPAPSLPAHMAGWERIAAHVSHFLLYAFMLAIPLSGWAMASDPNPRPLTWFGLFDIPYLPVSEAMSEFGHEAHEILGYAALVLLLVHVGAAFRHHFLIRDEVMARMTPGVRVPAPPA